MATDISSTNTIKDLTAGVKDLGDLKQASEDQIRDLFDDNYFNGGEKARGDIDAQIKSIQDQIKDWEKKLNDYQKEIDKIEDKIDGVSGDLADATGKYVSAQAQYEAELQTAINKAIVRAVNNTKSKNKAHEGQTSFRIEFQSELAKLMDNAALANISAIYNETGDLKGELGDLCDQLDLYIKDSGNAMNGLKNAQAVISLLNQTKDNMTAQLNNYYANKNNDSKVPVFSYEKEAVVAELADKYNSDLSGRNSTQNVGNNGNGVKNQAAIDKYMDQLAQMGKASTGKNADKNTADGDNALAQNLATALFGDKKAGTATTVQEGSLVWKMAEAGMSNIEIMDAIAKNFGGLNIAGSNGKYSIPYGHGSNAKRIYGALTSIANNTAGFPEIKTVPGDAKQLEQASDAVKVLADKGFSFKEAMFALDQLFPGLDIGYSLGEQAGTKEGCVRFTTDPSYDKLAQQIDALTKNGQVWQDSQVIRSKPVDNKPADTGRTDPISVQDGNSRYYFMADDGNGKYDGVSDMLGYENGMKDFETKYGNYITTNGAGEKVITGDALNSIMVMKLEEIQNADGSVSVQQSFMSAADAGMTEINLSSAKKDGSYNINGSEVQNTFNVKMNGKNMTAEQAMEDNEYIDATLNNKGLIGNNMFSQLTNAQIDKAFSDPLTGDFARINDLAQNVNQRAKDLKELADSKGGNLDWGDVPSEAEFRKKIKQELDDAVELAETKGDQLYREYQAQYNKAGDFGGYYNSKNEGLHEKIQDEITDEMQQKGYENYGKHEEIELDE